MLLNLSVDGATPHFRRTVHVPPAGLAGNPQQVVRMPTREGYCEVPTSSHQNQQASPVQFRPIRRHSLAASAAGRAPSIVSRSMNTSSLTLASSTVLSRRFGWGAWLTALKTSFACGCRPAAHLLAATSLACAESAATRQSNMMIGSAVFMTTILSNALIGNPNRAEAVKARLPRV